MAQAGRRHPNRHVARPARPKTDKAIWTPTSSADAAACRPFAYAFWSICFCQSPFLARSTDTIPDAADRMNERKGLLTVDLAANAADIDVDDVHVGRGIVMEVPDVLQQHRPRNNLAFVANQIFENPEFAGQQLYFAATTARSPRHEVKFEIADPKHCVLDNGIAAPGKGFDAREQFREGERLDEVIIAAGTQPAHQVIDLAHRTEYQGRRDNAVFPQATNDGKAIDSR